MDVRGGAARLREGSYEWGNGGRASRKVHGRESGVCVSGGRIKHCLTKYEYTLGLTDGIMRPILGQHV